MSEMHARVTRTLLPAFEHIKDPEYRETIAGCWARAAIEEMLSPTHEMVEKGAIFHRRENDLNGYNRAKDDAKTSWREMIKAALNRT
jgi:hypothetical protein